MKKTSLAAATLLTCLSTAFIMPSAYAEDGMNMNTNNMASPADKTNCDNCKKCTCTCGDNSTDTNTNANQTETTNSPGSSDTPDTQYSSSAGQQ